MHPSYDSGKYVKDRLAFQIQFLKPWSPNPDFFEYEYSHDEAIHHITTEFVKKIESLSDRNGDPNRIFEVPIDASWFYITSYGDRQPKRVPNGVTSKVYADLLGYFEYSGYTFIDFPKPKAIKVDPNVSGPAELDWDDSWGFPGSQDSTQPSGYVGVFPSKVKVKVN